MLPCALIILSLTLVWVWSLWYHCGCHRLADAPVMAQVYDTEFENLARKFAAVTVVSKQAFQTQGIAFR